MKNTMQRGRFEGANERKRWDLSLSDVQPRGPGYWNWTGSGPGLDLSRHHAASQVGKDGLEVKIFPEACFERRAPPGVKIQSTWQRRRGVHVTFVCGGRIPLPLDSCSTSITCACNVHLLGIGHGCERNFEVFEQLRKGSEGCGNCCVDA